MFTVWNRWIGFLFFLCFSSMALCSASVKFACHCLLHIEQFLCCSFRIKSFVIQAKSFFLNKESVQKELKTTLS